MVYPINLNFMNTFSNPRRFGYKPKYNSGTIDYRNTSIYQESNIDSFMFQKESDDSITLTSDISMLFNQQRLDKLSRDALIQRFDDFAVKNDSLRELRSKLSDDQLISLVKSRYIQTPSELMTYSSYLVHTLDSELSKLVQQGEIKHSDVVEPKKEEVTT